MMRLVRLLLITTIVVGVIAASFVIHVISGFEGNAELPADCALVFGAAVHGVDRAGPGIRRRVWEAAELYATGNVNRLIMSGGQGDSFQESEAAVMKELAIEYGVAAEDIAIEEQATSTIENLVYARPLVADCISIVGVSDRYHLSRIRFLADMSGYENFTVHPASYTAGTPFEIRSTLREAVAMVYYLIVLLQSSP